MAIIAQRAATLGQTGPTLFRQWWKLEQWFACKVRGINPISNLDFITGLFSFGRSRKLKRAKLSVFWVNPGYEKGAIYPVRPELQDRLRGEVKPHLPDRNHNIYQIKPKHRSRKRLFGLLTLFILLVIGNALSAQGVAALEIGDQVPEDFWTTEVQVIRDGEVQRRRLADYRGKAIILDFWGIYCVPCIEAFPKLGGWQKAYGDSLQIIGVTQTEGEKLKQFFSRRDPLGFPTVIADRFLNAMFKHAFIPHEVWIDAGGKVAGFTSAEKMSDESLKRFIATGKLAAAMKHDQDLSRPLFSNPALPLHQLAAYSILLKGHVEGTGTSFEKIDLENVHGITLTNQTLVSLLGRIGRMEIAGFNPKLLVIGKRDSLDLFSGKLKGKEKTDWYHEHCFSLSVVLKRTDQALLGKKMLALLQAQSGYDIVIEARNMDCMVLRVRQGNTLPISQGKMENNLEKPGRKNLRNGRTGDLVAWLNSKANGLPVVIDETGLRQGINLEISGSDENTLVTELAGQGLLLQRTQRNLTVMTIKKK